jgi:hypothetical protein
MGNNRIGARGLTTEGTEGTKDFLGGARRWPRNDTEIHGNDCRKKGPVSLPANHTNIANWWQWRLPMGEWLRSLRDQETHSMSPVGYRLEACLLITNH